MDNNITPDLQSQEKLQSERNKILDFARNKFHQEGFYKTSMDEIAEGLSMSKKTIYKHFASKEALLENICDDNMCKISDAINIIVDSKDDTVTKFAKILHVQGEHMTKISDRWVSDLKIHAPQFYKKLDEMKEEKINYVLTKLIEQGKSEGSIDNYPSVLITTMMVASVRSVLKPEFLMSSGLSHREAAKCSFELMLNGILTEKGRRLFSKKKEEIVKF